MRQVLQGDPFLWAQPVGDVVPGEAGKLGIQDFPAPIHTQSCGAVSVGRTVIVFLASAQNAGLVLQALLPHEWEALAPGGVILCDAGPAHAPVTRLEVAGIDALSPPAKLAFMAVFVVIAVVCDNIDKLHFCCIRSKAKLTNETSCVSREFLHPFRTRARVCFVVVVRVTDSI